MIIFYFRKGKILKIVLLLLEAYVLPYCGMVCFTCTVPVITCLTSSWCPPSGETCWSRNNLSCLVENFRHRSIGHTCFEKFERFVTYWDWFKWMFFGLLAFPKILSNSFSSFVVTRCDMPTGLLASFTLPQPCCRNSCDDPMRSWIKIMKHSCIYFAFFW